MSALNDTILTAIVPALSSSSLSVAGIAVAALVAGALAGKHRTAVRHVLLVAALAASVVATIASLSTASVTIQVPWWRQVVKAQTTDVAGVRDVARQASTPTPGDKEGVIAWLWLAGIACVALRATRQAAAARALRRRAVPVTDGTWTQSIALARDTMKYTEPLEVLVSAEIDIPFVMGLVRPAVLIPSAGTEWSAEEKRSVLAHEIAHLTRFDLWTRVVGQLACALQWFNPIVWSLASRAERDAELAADDLVLRSGILPSTYAEVLLSLAERIAWHRPAPAALAFVRRSSLEPRIHAVLATSGRRWLIGTRTRVAVIGASCGITAALGCVRLAPRTEVETRRLAPIETPVMRPGPATIAKADTSRPRAPRITGDWVDDAVHGLIRALDDPSPQVRSAAATSILRFDDGASRAAVDRALGNASLSRATVERIRTEKQ
jgi:beta-lactamase regulating signal transducer with metallopeptidase domain